jgi:aminomethyltransferase
VLAVTTDQGELAHTPLYANHVAEGARLVPFAGFEMPVQYAGVKQEHIAVRTAAGLFDVSHMGELELKGPAALGLINRLITNDASRLADGRAQYTCACNERGTILDDLIVYRHAAEDWMVVCNASNRDKIVAHFKAHLPDGCTLRDASDDTALLALQGPRALDIAALGGPDGIALAELKPFGLTQGQLFGVACTIARTGYTGEDGVEIFCAATDASALWQHILDAGKPKGLIPAGLAARDTLRLEARLSLYGNDIDETTNPLEAGLGWTVKLKKHDDFLGKAALAAIAAEGVQRKLVGFEMTGRGIARHGYPLFDGTGEKEIGITTSGSPAPTVGKNIGLGYVPIEHSAVGTVLLVDCRGKKIEAKVVDTPFYKREAKS